MNFIDSYKKLEKLCNEMYGDKHGVSLYIDEMINTPVGYLLHPVLLSAGMVLFHRLIQLLSL